MRHCQRSFLIRYFDFINKLDQAFDEICEYTLQMGGLAIERTRAIVQSDDTKCCDSDNENTPHITLLEAVL